MSRTKDYVVAYIIRRGRADWPHAKVVRADNAHHAREAFDAWYYSKGRNEKAALPHPFHITVKKLDGLAVCPLCGASMLWKPSAVECQARPMRCGLTVKLPDPE